VKFGSHPICSIPYCDILSYYYVSVLFPFIDILSGVLLVMVDLSSRTNDIMCLFALVKTLYVIYFVRRSIFVYYFGDNIYLLVEYLYDCNAFFLVSLGRQTSRRHKYLGYVKI